MLERTLVDYVAEVSGPISDSCGGDDRIGTSSGNVTKQYPGYSNIDICSIGPCVSTTRSRTSTMPPHSGR